MKIDRSLFFTILGVVLVMGVLWAVWELSPSRQVGKAFERLIAATEARNWKKVRSLMAEDYHDAWGMNHEQAVSGGAEVFRHFFVLEITVEKERLSVAGSRAEVLARLRIVGRGTAVAQEVMERVNAFRNDFQFAWRRESWLPWSWKLVSVSQDEISFDSSWIP